MEALTGATADAGSIPAASIFPANRDFGMEHLTLAHSVELAERVGQVGGVKLRVPGGRPDIGMAEQKLREAKIVMRPL